MPERCKRAQEHADVRYDELWGFTVFWREATVAPHSQLSPQALKWWTCRWCVLRLLGSHAETQCYKAGWGCAHESEYEATSMSLSGRASMRGSLGRPVGRTATVVPPSRVADWLQAASGVNVQAGDDLKYLRMREVMRFVARTCL